RLLELECGGLVRNAVRAADREGVLVANREDTERLGEPLLPGDQEIDRVAELKCGGGVPDVTGGQPDVDEARVLADLLLEAPQQREHLALHPPPAPPRSGEVDP